MKMITVIRVCLREKDKNDDDDDNNNDDKDDEFIPYITYSGVVQMVDYLAKEKDRDEQH